MCSTNEYSEAGLEVGRVKVEHRQRHLLPLLTYFYYFGGIFVRGKCERRRTNFYKSVVLERSDTNLWVSLRSMWIGLGRGDVCSQFVVVLVLLCVGIWSFTESKDKSINHIILYDQLMSDQSSISRRNGSFIKIDGDFRCQLGRCRRRLLLYCLRLGLLYCLLLLLGHRWAIGNHWRRRRSVGDAGLGGHHLLLLGLLLDLDIVVAAAAGPDVQEVPDEDCVIMGGGDLGRSGWVR
jgi:hypothetical protein